jgi:hypothetical protein
VCVQVPNFGFVVFDSEEAVEKALASRPIMLEGNHRWGTEREIKNDDSRIGPWGILIVEWKKSSLEHCCGSLPSRAMSPFLQVEG